MTEQLMEIGMRLRALREISCLSTEDIAKATGVSADDYRKYENGEKDFSFSFLHNAAKALNVDVADIMSGVSPKLSSYSLVRAGRGYNVERRKAYSYMALAHTFRNRRAEPFLVTVAPMEDLPELHSHEGQEFQYLLSGNARVMMGDSELVMHSGDAIYFDSATPHALAAIGDESARFIAVVIN